MVKIRAFHRNKSFLDIEAEDCLIDEMAEYFSFHPPGYKFHPSFKKRRWDGKVKLISGWNRSPYFRKLYAGLLPQLREFCADRGYELEELGNRTPKPEFTSELARAYFLGLEPSRVVGGELVPFTPDDDQIEAFRQAIDRERITIISPTSSGKSAIMYATTRFLLESCLARKVLIIVPRMQLVDQMHGDFKSYSATNGWDVDALVHRIYAGQEKNDVRAYPVVISTWQSIFRMPRDWFIQFDAVLPDEAHGAKAKSLTEVLEWMTEARWRIGTTGTLEDTAVNKLVIAGLIGEPTRITTVKKLMNAGRVANTVIVMVQFVYDDAVRKHVSQKFQREDGGKPRAMSYAEEYEFLCVYPGRTQAIASLLAAQEDQNSVVFFSRISHGKAILDAVAPKIGDRELYYVDGGIDRRSRELNRSSIEKQRGAVYVASLGTTSTGISINNLHVAVLASPVKSETLHLQTLGRLLRLDDDGIGSVVYDVVDDLAWKGQDNYALKHAGERAKHYVAEGHKVTTATVRIP